MLSVMLPQLMRKYPGHSYCPSGTGGRYAGLVNPYHLELPLLLTIYGHKTTLIG